MPALRPIRFAILAVVALVLLAALAPAGARAAASVTIRIGSNLSPAVVTVASGTRLVWVNGDDERHRVRSRNGPVEFDSGNIEPGESWSTTLIAQGTYRYLDDRDRDNVSYSGRIIVRAAGGPSASSGSGSAGGGSAGGGTETGGPGTGGAGTGGAGAPPSNATVSIGDDTFAPSTVSVAAGGSVTWRNDDDRDHTATARGAGFDTGSLAAGATATERFPSAGTFAYLCAIHPDMQGTVRVVAVGGAASPAAPAAPKPTLAPSAPPPVDVPTPGGGETGADPTLALRIVDLAFAPASASVAAGTTVTWTNDGVAPHTVTANDSAFDSGMLASGASWSMRFDDVGTFAFLCAVHPDMRGELTVTARVAPAGAAGSAASPSTRVPAPARPDPVAPAAVEVVPSPPPLISEAASSIETVDDGEVTRAAITLLVCVVAMGLFGRLVGGSARH